MQSLIVVRGINTLNFVNGGTATLYSLGIQQFSGTGIRRLTHEQESQSVASIREQIDNPLRAQGQLNLLSFPSGTPSEK